MTFAPSERELIELARDTSLRQAEYLLVDFLKEIYLIQSNSADQDEVQDLIRRAREWLARGAYAYKEANKESIHR